ncbi:MAG: GMP/IMP nucleotidase [Aquisalimonadaceae bacterium]
MISWSRTDTVLLDMDGTLLDLHFDNCFWLEVIPQRFASDRGISVESAREQVVPLMAAVQGTLDWYCLDYWQARLDIDVVALKREHAHLIRFRPGAEAFLGALRAAGKRAVLVTNAHRDSLSLKLERVPLAGYLDRVISSHDLGAPKEAAVFWESLQALEGFDPARTVLLDDSVAVLSAARDYGLGAVYGIARPDTTRPPLAPKGFPLVEAFEAVCPPPASGEA